MRSNTCNGSRRDGRNWFSRGTLEEERSLREPFACSCHEILARTQTRAYHIDFRRSKEQGIVIFSYRFPEAEGKKELWYFRVDIVSFVGVASISFFMQLGCVVLTVCQILLCFFLLTVFIWISRFWVFVWTLGCIFTCCGMYVWSAAVEYRIRAMFVLHTSAILNTSPVPGAFNCSTFPKNIKPQLSSPRKIPCVIWRK